jgi:hypothetical protein
MKSFDSQIILCVAKWLNRGGIQVYVRLSVVKDANDHLGGDRDLASLDGMSAVT